MGLVEVTKSPIEGKKWRAVFNTQGRIHHTDFGASGMNDYTLTGDKQARARYRIRHQKDLMTNDPTRAGFLSYYLLWNKPSLSASINDYKKKFNL